MKLNQLIIFESICNRFSNASRSERTFGTFRLKFARTMLFLTFVGMANLLLLSLILSRNLIKTPRVSTAGNFIYFQLVALKPVQLLKNTEKL